jgi:hypothetical protein
MTQTLFTFIMQLIKTIFAFMSQNVTHKELLLNEIVKHELNI